MESTEYKEGFDAYMENEIDCPYDIEDGSEYFLHIERKKGWRDARRIKPEIFDSAININD